VGIQFRMKGGRLGMPRPSGASKLQIGALPGGGTIKFPCRGFFV